MAIYNWFTHKKWWFFHSYVSLPEGREKATPFLEKSQLMNCFCVRLSHLASATVACADLLICKWQPTQNLPYACTKKDILNWTGFWFDDVWNFHHLGGYSSKKKQPKLDASKQQMTMTIHFWVQHFVTFGVAIPPFHQCRHGWRCVRGGLEGRGVPQNWLYPQGKTSSNPTIDIHKMYILQLLYDMCLSLYIFTCT